MVESWNGNLLTALQNMLVQFLANTMVFLQVLHGPNIGSGIIALYFICISVNLYDKESNDFRNEELKHK